MLKPPLQTLLFMAALVPGAALAQTAPTRSPTAAQETQTATLTDLPALQNFLKAGGTVQLLDADGGVVGTVNADGTVTLQAGATLADVKSVKVTAADQSSRTFDLARDPGQPGTLKVNFTLSSGKVVSLPLPAVLNRQAEDHHQTGQQKVPAARDDRPSREAPAHPDKPGKPAPGPGK